MYGRETLQGRGSTRGSKKSSFMDTVRNALKKIFLKEDVEENPVFEITDEEIERAWRNAAMKVYGGRL